MDSLKMGIEFVQPFLGGGESLEWSAIQALQ